MLKFRVVNLRDTFYGSLFSSAKCLEQRNILQAAINEIGEKNIRHITNSSEGTGSISFTIFYHEDDPA